MENIVILTGMVGLIILGVFGIINGSSELAVGALGAIAGFLTNKKIGSNAE